MIIGGTDVILWVFAFIMFIVFVVALVELFDAGDGFIDGLIAFITGALCAASCLAGLNDAEHRWQDRQAKRDFEAASYDYTYVSRRTAKLPIGDCLPTFNVHKVDGVYRPVIPSASKGWAVITPDWQKKTTCPA